MSSYVSAPGQAPPICQNCSTSTTPLWRRDESGSVLCNACGLFLKLHGRPRPISLKTDVIKSRNRVKTGQNGQKKKPPFSAQGLPAAHPEMSSPLPPGSMPRIPSMPHMITDSDDRHELHTSTPTSPSGGHHLHHATNIAPSHMFDAVTIESGGHRSLENSFVSPTPYYSAPQARHGSPLSMLNGAASSSDSQIQTTLKTRISELEVINELFRGRVTELENTERDLRQQLDESMNREQELRRRIDELEASHAMLFREDGDRHLKRLRTSDFINDDSDMLESQPQPESQPEHHASEQQAPSQIEENRPEDAAPAEVGADAERTGK